MKVFSKQSRTFSEDDNSYWMSFTDLMSALLVIFILAAVALIIELSQRSDVIEDRIDDLKRAEEARREILREIQAELEKSNIIVEVADNDSVLRIPEESLTFQSGDDDLPQDGKTRQIVVKIGEALRNAVTRDERFQYLNTVFVEGHTDSVPIYYRGKGNWGLSVDRAITVWNVWEEELTAGVRLSDLENAFGEKLFSVSGYANTRRIEFDESSDSLRSRNRRIDLRFTVKTPSLEDLEAISASAR